METEFVNINLSSNQHFIFEGNIIMRNIHNIKKYKYLNNWNLYQKYLFVNRIYALLKYRFDNLFSLNRSCIYIWNLFDISIFDIISIVYTTKKVVTA